MKHDSAILLRDSPGCNPNTNIPPLSLPVHRLLVHRTFWHYKTRPAFAPQRNQPWPGLTRLERLSSSSPHTFHFSIIAISRQYDIIAGHRRIPAFCLVFCSCYCFYSNGNNKDPLSPNPHPSSLAAVASPQPFLDCQGEDSKTGRFASQCSPLQTVAPWPDQQEQPPGYIYRRNPHHRLLPLSRPAFLCYFQDQLILFIFIYLQLFM